MQEEVTSAVESRPTIRSTRTVASNLADTFPREVQREAQPVSNAYSRPVLSRVPTFEGPTQLRQDQSPVASQWIQRTTSDTLTSRRNSTYLNTRAADPYADSEVSSYGSYGRSSPERMYGDRSCSPATSHGSSVASRQPSSTALNASHLSKKAPPPPPPSRSKKPPPPPPPMKRSLSTAPTA